MGQPACCIGGYTHELLVEIFDAVEYPARDDVSLDAGKPVLDLIEP